MASLKEGGDTAKAWIPDFFDTTWARVTDGSFLLLVSAWVWIEAIPAMGSDSGTMARPLDWYATQIQPLGWNYPEWLASIADWRSVPGLWWPQMVVLAGAIMFTLAATKAKVPGYRLVAMLLLILSMQWFGVHSTLVSYLSILTGIVGFALVRCWIDSKFISGQDGQFSYYPEIVFRHAINGIGGVIVLPILAPFSALAYAVQVFGFENSQLGGRHGAQAVAAVLDRASTQPGSAHDMSARDQAILLASVELAAHSDEDTRREVAAMIRYRHSRSIGSV